MDKMIKPKILIRLLAMLLFLPLHIIAFEQVEEGEFQPMVVPQFFEEAKKNTSWKRAFATAEHEQIVFMNISPKTNPNSQLLSPKGESLSFQFSSG